VTAFGRIANFINSEHLGFPSSLPWCVVFQRIDDVCRHPVQLYESITQVMLFGILIFLSKKKPKKGRITYAYIFFYSLFRFTTDFFRSTYTVFFFGLALSQIVSIALMAVSLYLYFSSKK
jgi:prolipoprotein diacylglyceryltransferase